MFIYEHDTHHRNERPKFTETTKETRRLIRTLAKYAATKPKHAWQTTS